MSDAATQPHSADVLPGERAHATTAGRLATLVVIVLSLIVLANVGAAALLARVPVNGGYAWANGKWSLMERSLAEGRRLDALIVGDSSANQGLNPAMIRARTGQRTMNFGVVAEALSIESVWAVREWFEHTPAQDRPRAVYWMHVCDVWNRRDDGNRRLLAITSAMPPSVWPQVEAGPPVKFTIDEIRWRRRMPLWAQSASMQMLIRRPIASFAAAHRYEFDADGFTAERLPDPDQRIAVGGPVVSGAVVRGSRRAETLGGPAVAHARRLRRADDVRRRADAKLRPRPRRRRGRVHERGAGSDRGDD